jgi:hypothetical protein
MTPSTAHLIEVNRATLDRLNTSDLERQRLASAASSAA